MYVRSTVSGNTIDRVSDLLFRYKNIPHSTTGKTSAELFLKHVPKTRFKWIKASVIHIEGPRTYVV